MEKIIHYDLFSGIGGFAYAVDSVWDNVEHIFCEIDPFCRQVIKKHWKGAKIYGDIREINEEWIATNTNHWRPPKQKQQTAGDKQCDRGSYCDILTGGFPCQPFSCAGKQRGTQDNRYLWPEMFRVIRITKPHWCVIENVRGLLTIGGGLVFEQMCLDLENEGYEVQAFIIPAVAVNAPHRRDRVWIIANATNNGLHRHSEKSRVEGEISQDKEQSGDRRASRMQGCDWQRPWLEVATKLCGVDDELSTGLDFAGYTKAQHRVQRLKALGNAIVPQVAIQILEAINRIR